MVDEIDSAPTCGCTINERLPSLLRMFPKVQFVVTTHSQLFVLGMSKVFGEDGFAMYRMPHGQKMQLQKSSVNMVTRINRLARHINKLMT